MFWTTQLWGNFNLLYVLRFYFFFISYFSLFLHIHLKKTNKKINDFLVHVFKLKTPDATLSSNWIREPQIHTCTNHTRISRSSNYQFGFFLTHCYKYRPIKHMMMTFLNLCFIQFVYILPFDLFTWHVCKYFYLFY